MHHTHAATAATSSRLDNDRIANLPCELQGAVGIVVEGSVGTGHCRHAGFAHDLDGRHLVSHESYGFRAGPDESEAAFLDLFGEIRVLCQEAITGMHCNCVCHLHGGDNGGDIKITVSCRSRADADRFISQTHMHQVAVGIGMHGDRFYAQFPAGSKHAERDFAAVGNKYFF